MILKKIKIKDFLSVRGTVSFDVDKNVTILLGANDHGKSNLLHAIKCLNRDCPIDDSQKNWDAADADDAIEPQLDFEFQLTPDENTELTAVLEKECQALKEEIQTSSG